MDWGISSPASFRANNVMMNEWAPDMPSFVPFKKKPHDSHPSMGHLTLLVFEAVMEVVCVALPGYVIARLGHFDAEKQKFLANLNVQIFTPCLIFTKLASQLNASKLVELAVIPFIFLLQTLVSYLVSVGVAKACRLKKRPANFVTAMAVFGNSNSLPISLVISLSQTLKGLHWDRIPGDNDDEVAARGILYLMIFQQLGQLVRWTWGYNVLLAPKKPEDSEEVGDDSRTLEEGNRTDEAPPGAGGVLIPGLDGLSHDGDHEDGHRSSDESDAYEPAGRTPVASTSRASPNESEDEEDAMLVKKHRIPGQMYNIDGSPFVLHHNGSEDEIMSFPRMHESDEPEASSGVKGLVTRAKFNVKRSWGAFKTKTTRASQRAFHGLPLPVQNALAKTGNALSRFFCGLAEFMNPPLWAMLIAIIVASIPDLQRLFFEDGSFIKNSVTSAVSSSAGVAVPLILVVLGANLARNTQNSESKDPEEDEIKTRLLVASLVSRMLLPTIIMAPILALVAKYVPVSILDDPIFVIVCFLLSGAPSALQLAQICQLNEVYELVMSKILFQSYVVWWDLTIDSHTSNAGTRDR
ncbi:putative Auxin efflux carrier [Seiridium unicorne]|uniref:Auxin efflux carrier n=1 Tax=Seiridium unicorne TaxID=138068 RepID=A0ABR2UXJ3_9PEZI